MQVDYNIKFNLPAESEELLIVTQCNTLSKKLTHYREWLVRKACEAAEKKDEEAVALFSIVEEQFDSFFMEYTK